MRALVLSLTRFGDLLQTQPVFSGLKARGCETGLVCLENFAQAAGLLTDVDRVAPLRGAGLLAALDADWRGGLAELERFLSGLRSDFAPDLVVNLTPSLSARLLARSLGGAEVRGFAVDEFGFNADTSAWAAFLQLAATERGASPFNVVDLFLRAAGLRGPGSPLALAPDDAQARQEADVLLAGALPDAAHKGFVAVQLGASEERRRWPAASFARTAQELYRRRGLAAMLLGSGQERPLAERFKALAPDLPCADLVGRTGLKELAAALRRADLLVTNDTGTMHLGAGLGLPVVAVFLATAQPWDTGPYRPGCLCLEPDTDCHPCAFGQDCRKGEMCRGLVPAEAAVSCAESLLDGRRPEAVAGARIWGTEFDAEGMLTLRSFSGHGDSGRAAFIRWQRWFYRRFLDGEPLDQDRPPDAAPPPDARQELANILAQAHDLLLLVTGQAALLRRDPRPSVKSKFIAAARRIQGVLAADPRLSVLGGLWHFELERSAQDLAGITAAAERYRDLMRALCRSLGRHVG